MANLTFEEAIGKAFSISVALDTYTQETENTTFKVEFKNTSGKYQVWAGLFLWDTQDVVCIEYIPVDNAAEIIDKFDKSLDEYYDSLYSEGEEDYYNSLYSDDADYDDDFDELWDEYDDNEDDYRFERGY